MTQKQPLKKAVAKELWTIAGDVGKDLLSIFIPPTVTKPNWCQCGKCGGWHHRTN